MTTIHVSIDHYYAKHHPAVPKRPSAEQTGAVLIERISAPARSAAAQNRRNAAAAALQERIERMAGCYVSIGDTRPMHAAAAIIAGRDPFSEQFPEEEA